MDHYLYIREHKRWNGYAIGESAQVYFALGKGILRLIMSLKRSNLVVITCKFNLYF